MITRTEIFGTEELILERNPQAFAAFRAVSDAARASILELHARFGDSTDEATLSRLDGEVDAIITRALAEYAGKATGLVTAEDHALWLAKISRVKGSYVGRAREAGVPGALMLLESMEEADLGDEASQFISLDSTLANAAEYCQCGYATSRVVPEKFCFICSEALLNEWRAEEDRVLAQAPARAAEVEVVLDELLTTLAELHLEGGDSQQVAGVRHKAGKELARVNGSSTSALDLTRWNELAGLNERSGIEAVHADRRRWSDWGLGSARSAEWALRNAPELEVRMRRIAGPRPASTPSFFGRLFGRS